MAAAVESGAVFVPVIDPAPQPEPAQAAAPVPAPAAPENTPAVDTGAPEIIRPEAGPVAPLVEAVQKFPRSRGKQCLVDGCTKDRKTMEHPKARQPLTCDEHSNALTVVVNGEQTRECQACRTFHPLAAFTKTKRTCDNRLKRKRERYYHGHKKGKTGEEGQAPKNEEEDDDAHPPTKFGGASTSSGHEAVFAQKLAWQKRAAQQQQQQQQFGGGPSFQNTKSSMDAATRFMMEAANWQDQSSYPSTYDFSGMTPQMLAAMMQHFGGNGVNMPAGGGVNMPGMPSEFQLMMEGFKKHWQEQIMQEMMGFPPPRNQMPDRPSWFPGGHGGGAPSLGSGGGNNVNPSAAAAEAMKNLASSYERMRNAYLVSGSSLGMGPGESFGNKGFDASGVAYPTRADFVGINTLAEMLPRGNSKGKGVDHEMTSSAADGRAGNKAPTNTAPQSKFSRGGPANQQDNDAFLTVDGREIKIADSRSASLVRNHKEMLARTLREHLNSNRTVLFSVGDEILCLHDGAEDSGLPNSAMPSNERSMGGMGGPAGAPFASKASFLSKLTQQ